MVLSQTPLLQKTLYFCVVYFMSLLGFFLLLSSKFRETVKNEDCVFQGILIYCPFQVYQQNLHINFREVYEFVT